MILTALYVVRKSQSSLKIKKQVNYWANQGSEFHQEIFACLKKVV